MMELDVCLKKREGESWGFRLIGGIDYGMPLTVVKVTPNTPAERAGLRKGDAVVEVNGRDAADMTHEQSREAVAGADDNLMFGVVRGLYDLQLDDTEPLFETDQQDFDQPLATEVDLEVPCPIDSHFKPINPEFDIKIDAAKKQLNPNDLGAFDLENDANGFRSLTSSPYVHQIKPYRPFSTEPIEIPPVENPIILNPNYHDDFAKLFIDEDLLPATKFKLPISEQYDPDGTKIKLKNGGLTTQVEEVISTEETTLKEVKEESITHDKVDICKANESIVENSFKKDSKEQTKIKDVRLSDKIGKSLDVKVIELTATNIVDESIEKAVIVAEEIKNEIAVELSETKEVSSKNILKTEDIKDTEQTKEEFSLETNLTEMKKHVEMTDKTSEEILKTERTNEIINQETASLVINQNVELINKTSENVDEFSVCEKSEQYEDDPAIVKRKISEKENQETVSEQNEISSTVKSSNVKNKVKVKEVNKSQETNQRENIANAQIKAETTNEKMSSAKYSTTKLLSEQKAYTIDLQTIPNLRGSVHSSYHYDLLLRTFFIHLTDVMVALSRFILAEPVPSKTEKSTAETTQQKNATKVVEEHATQESIIIQKQDIQEAAKLDEMSKKECIVENKNLSKVATNAVSFENNEQNKMHQKSVAKESLKTNVASKDKVVTHSSLEQVESKANVEVEHKKYVECDSVNNLEMQTTTNKKVLSGSKMAQLTEKKSEDLMQNMEAVLTEFESKSVGEDIAIVRDRRSRSRSRAEERIFEYNNEETKTDDVARTTKVVRDERNNTSTTKISQSVNKSSSNETLLESGNTYVAIVEAHVYTNKDAIFNENLNVNSIQNESSTENVQTNISQNIDKVAKNETFIAESDKAVVQHLNKKVETIKEDVKHTIEASKAEENSVDIEMQSKTPTETIIAKSQQPDIIKTVNQTNTEGIAVPKVNTDVVFTAEKIEEINKETTVKEAVAINRDYKKTKKNVIIEEILEPIVETQGVNSDYIVTEAKEDAFVVVDEVSDVTVIADAFNKIAQKADVKEIMQDIVEEETLTKNVEILKNKTENQYNDIKYQAQLKNKEEKIAVTVEEKSTKQESFTANNFELNIINAMESAVNFENLINKHVAKERLLETKASQDQLEHVTEKVSITSTKQEFTEDISSKQNTENLLTLTTKALRVADTVIENMKETQTKDIVVMKEEKSDISVMENSVARIEDRVSERSIKETTMEGESANLKITKQIITAATEYTTEAHSKDVVVKKEENTDVSIQNDYAAKTEERISQKSMNEILIKEDNMKFEMTEKEITKLDVVNKKIEENTEKSLDNVEINILANESTINNFESQTVEQESSFVAKHVDNKALKLSLDTELAKNCSKTSITSVENNNLETPSPATVPPTPLTDEYVFKLEIPLAKRDGPPIPRDCTPSDDEEDPHIVKKGLVPIVEAEIAEQTIFDPPLPTPPVTPGSPKSLPTSPQSPRSPTSPNGPKFPRYTKPGLRGGSDRDYAKEEILEIERKSSLLASAIDQTIKSIEEYKQEVGIKETSPPQETNGVIYNGYAKVVETKVFDTALNNSVKLTPNTGVTNKSHNKIEETDTQTVISESKIETAEVKIDNKSTHSKEYNDSFTKTADEPIVSGEIKIIDANIEERKEELVKEFETKNYNGTEVETFKQEMVNTTAVEDKRDPMEGYKSVHFDPEELLNAQRERRALYAQVPQMTASQERELYKNEKGEIIGTKRGIVDGLEQAVVEPELAKELGKPGITETKIAELISGESEMLREAHVMGLKRALALHMQRNDCSVDFNKLKPIVESLKDSEVLKALNEEMLKAYEEKKKKEEKKWTTFLQKPKRPVPRSSKFGFPEPEEQAEPYKVKIVKQPKPKVAPDYKPKDFNTGLLPWEERALREPTPPPVDPEEPILIPEEEPEILEAVDPLPESEVPDLEDSGIQLPQEPVSETPPPEQIEEVEELEAEVDIDLEAVIEETEKIVEDNLVKEMDKNNLAEQLIMSVQNMVDPNATLDQQLAQMRAQLAALAQLPGVIQQSLEIVTKQLSQLSQLEATQQSSIQEEEIKNETTPEETKQEVQENHTETTVSDEPNKPAEESQPQEPQVPQVPVEVEQTLTPEELERMKKEEEAMIEEQRRMEKMKKEAMEQARIEHESRQVKQHSVPRVGKPKPVFGPATPQERPLVLPGGRKWRKPKDAYNEQFFTETLAAQAEIIAGKAKGINFMKYEKPPVSLDHLKHSDVYKLIHDAEDRPPKRVELLTPVLAESDYREKCRSMTPCAERIAQQVQP